MNELSVPAIGFVEDRLDNGLQVILHRNDRAPLVHLSVHYRVGSSCEQHGFSGFAHLFEHMMFQGSANVPKNDHGRLIDSVGGRWNASTSKDRTNYHETVPAHELELALWLEADRMRSLEVTEENFENQRATVIEEKKQSYDNRPYGPAYLRFDELAYSNWAYGHPIIGSENDLLKATIEDALAFHEAYYGPGNATLVLAGDIRIDEARELVRTYFRDIPDRTAPVRPDLSEPPQTAEKREVMTDPLAVLPGISIGYHMPPLDTEEHYALSLLSTVLAEGESSRLYRRLVYDNNWITGLYVGPNQYRGPQVFRLAFQVQQEADPATVEEVIDEELERACREVVSDHELERARNQITYRFATRLGTVYQVGELLGNACSVLGDPQAANRQLDRFLEVTPEQIRQAAETAFAVTNRTLILIQPEHHS